METATTLLAGLTILLAFCLLLFRTKARAEREQDTNTLKTLVEERSRTIEERSRMMDERSRSLDYMQSRLNALQERDSQSEPSTSEAAAREHVLADSYGSHFAALSTLNSFRSMLTQLAPLKEASPILSDLAALRGVNSVFLIPETALYIPALAALKSATPALMVPGFLSYNTLGRALVRPPMFSHLNGIPTQWIEDPETDEAVGIPEWVRSTVNPPSAGANNPHRKENVKRYGGRGPTSSQGLIFQTAS